MKRIIIFGVILALILVIGSGWLIQKKYRDYRYSNKQIKSIQIDDTLTTWDY